MLKLSQRNNKECSFKTIRRTATEPTVCGGVLLKAKMLAVASTNIATPIGNGRSQSIEEATPQPMAVPLPGPLPQWSESVETTMAMKSEPSPEQTEPEDDDCEDIRDFCDLPPNGQLCDRSEEQDRLLRCYRNILRTPAETAILDCEEAVPLKENLVIVSGPSGSGKTSLVCNSLERIVEEDGGYFVVGKFDQFPDQQPYRAFVEATDGFVHQVMEREEIQIMQRAIHDALDSDCKMLTAMLPPLEQILGSRTNPLAAQQQQQQSAHGMEVLRRFAMVFRWFLEAISSLDHPLVFVLDDIHWADDCSLALLLNVIAEVPSTANILFVCTCINTLDTKSLVSSMLRDLESRNVFIESIGVHNLSKDSTNEMVAGRLNVTRQESEKLSNVIWTKTKGNALLIVEYLRILLEEGTLTFDKATKKWWWDDDDTHVPFDCEGVHGILVAKLNRLPQPLRELLKVSACFGSKVEEGILAKLFSTPVSTFIQECLQRGLLKDSFNSGEYYFANDGIQQASYALENEEGKAALHLAIGQRLAKSLNEEQMESYHHVVLAQYKKGESIIESQKERNAVASLALRTGEKAVASQGFRFALNCFTFGIKLLGQRCWREDYLLCLDLHSAQAECLYVLSDFEKVLIVVDNVMENARSFHDTLRVTAIKMMTYGATDRSDDVLRIGVGVLKKLGQNVNLGRVSLLLQYKHLKKKLRGMSPERILRLPQMNDGNALACMQIYNLMFLHGWIRGSRICALIGLRMVGLTLKHGLCAMSAYGFVLFGLVTAGFTKDATKGLEYAQLAITIVEYYQAKQWLTRVYTMAYGCLYMWKQPLADCVGRLKHAYRVGVQTGDGEYEARWEVLCCSNNSWCCVVEYGFMAANMFSFLSLDIGSPLGMMVKDLADFTRAMEIQKHQFALLFIRPFTGVVHSLVGKVDYVNVLKSTWSEYEVIARRNDFFDLVFGFERMIAALIFNDLDVALAMGRPTWFKLKEISMASFDMCQFLYFYCIAMARRVREQEGVPRTERLRTIVFLRRALRRLRAAAQVCPRNCGSKAAQLEAELATLKGNVKEAHVRYTYALAVAQAENFLMEVGIGGESAARYMVSCGREDLARYFAHKSYAAYEKWGAHAKTRQLTTQLLQLFDD